MMRSCLSIILSGAIATGILVSTAPLQSRTPPTGGAGGKQAGAPAVPPDELLAALLATPADQVPKAPEGLPVFEKLCASCHRFGELGNDVGPDLTTLNSRFKKKDILESILWPSRIISDQYESFMIETTGGDIITGAVVMEDDRRIVLRTAQNPDRPVQVPKSQIKTQQKSDVSLMPAALLTGLTHKEINALIAFLQAGPSKTASASPR